MHPQSARLVQAHLNALTLANYRPRTLRSRKITLEHFERTLEGRHLGQADRLDVEAFLARDLAPESRRAYLAHLRGMYGWAVEEGHYPSDPTERLKPIRVPKGGPRPIDAKLLLLAVQRADPRMRAWLLLMALGGLRCMEVAGLRPRDLLTTDSGVLLYLTDTKGGGSATVPAHPQVLEALAALPIRDACWWSVKPDTVSVSVSRYLRGLGIDATAHQLRHSAATAWYRSSGHDLLTTAQLMRHASVKTSQIYAALDPTRPAEVVNLVPHLRAV